MERERGTCCALPVSVDRGWAAERAALLKAVADPTRLTMLAVLHRAASPVCVCDFTAELGLTQPTISHHMGKLREVGLVEAEKAGIWTHYRLPAELPAELGRLLESLLA